MIRKLASTVARNKLISVIVLLGGAVSLLAVLPSGSRYCFYDMCGLYFWGANEFDGIWHLSLINNAFDRYPFTNPIFSGQELAGYNYFLDLLIAVIAKCGISASMLYFKIFPVVWLIALVYVISKLTKHQKKDNIYVAFLYFFIFFGSTCMYMLTLYHKGTIFELNSFGGALNLINMQFGYSLVIFITLMYALLSQKSSIRRDIVIGSLVALSFAFKFYAGFMTGIFALTFIISELAIHRKLNNCIRSVVFIGGISAIAVILVYDPFAATQSKEQILKFEPFVHSRRIIEEPDQVYLPSLALARYALQEQGIGPRLLAIELFSLGIYLLLNFGTRIVGFLTLTRLLIKNKLSQLDISLAVTIAAGIAMMALFVQRGQWWNTIQFFYYSLFLSSFFAAQFMSDLLKKKTAIRLAIALTIVILTIPFNLDVLRTFGNLRNPASYIPDAELEALEFLKDQKNGTVVTLHPRIVPNSQFDFTYQKDSPYVSAYGMKHEYVTGIDNLQLLGIDYEERFAKVQRLDPTILNDVDYVYAIQPADISPFTKKLEILFENESVIIYGVQ